jgi:hypothetical protein
MADIGLDLRFVPAGLGLGWHSTLSMSTMTAAKSRKMILLLGILKMY